MLKPDHLQRLVVARADLASAQDIYNNLASAEAVAAASSQTFAAWRSKRDSAAIELERLTRLAAFIETEIEGERQRNAADARRKRVAAAKKRNEDLATRIVSVGAELRQSLKSIMETVAAANADDNDLNASRGEGDEQVVSAEFLARGYRQGISKEILDEKILSLWVFKASGNIVPDPDIVAETAPGEGYISSASGSWVCVQQKHAVRTIYAAEPAIYLLPLLPFLSQALQALDHMRPHDQLLNRKPETEYEAIEPIPDLVRSDMQETFSRLNRERAASR